MDCSILRECLRLVADCIYGPKYADFAGKHWNGKKSGLYKENLGCITQHLPERMITNLAKRMGKVVATAAEAIK